MDQPGVDALGGLGQIGSADGVHLEGGLGVCLAAVHVGEGGAADDGIGLMAAHKGDGGVPVGDVQLGHVGGDDGGVFQPLRHTAQGAAAVFQLALDLGAQLAAGAGDEDLHAKASLSI